MSVSRCLHQIWIGGPIPEHIKNFCHEWKLMHPGWEYHLWGNDSLDYFPWTNRSLIKSAPNFSVASDIMRYDLLYQIGGVYLDSDMYQIRLLDEINYHPDLNVAIESDLHFHVGFIGASPRHPLFRECLKAIPSRINNKEKNSSWKSGPGMFTEVLERYPDRYEMPLHSWMPYDFSYKWVPDPTQAWQKAYPRDKNLIRREFPECIGGHIWSYSWGGK